MAFETAGTYSDRTKFIVRDTGPRLTKATGDQRETFYFMEKMSSTVQQDNAVGLLYGERERQCYIGSHESFKPTRSSVNEFPLRGVVNLPMDSLRVILLFYLNTLFRMNEANINPPQKKNY